MVQDFTPDPTELQAELLSGLQADEKSIDCKFLYDERGSQLFDRICTLHEYYPTRTEREILYARGDEIAAAIGERALIIEYGSGSSIKTRILLDHLPRPAAYVPIDISREHLLKASRGLQERYPELEILPVVADYTAEFEIPSPRTPANRRIVYFPGSTIGNFSRFDAELFLKNVARVCGPLGGVLIGVDLIKDREILERAYDDREGVTEAFMLNVLTHLNREHGAEFDLARFEYQCEWNESQRRVEMGVVSLEEQSVALGPARFELAEGEFIHIENSHKYSVEGFAELAARADLQVERVWTDTRALFSIQYLTAS